MKEKKEFVEVLLLEKSGKWKVTEIDDGGWRGQIFGTNREDGATGTHTLNNKEAIQKGKVKIAKSMLKPLLKKQKEINKQVDVCQKTLDLVTNTNE